MKTQFAWMPLVTLLLGTMVSAQDRVLDCLRCCNVASPMIPSEHGAITIRAWPISPVRMPLNSASVGLSTAIADIDTMAMVGSHILQKQLSDESGTSLLASRKTTDTLVFARGQEITFFPRVLLSDPRVALSAVRSGDFIATMFFRNVEIGEGAEGADRLIETDPFRILTLESKDMSVLSELFVTGPLLTRSQSKLYPIKPTTPPLRRVNAENFRTDNPIIESDIKTRFGDGLRNQIPVRVVRRRHSSYLVRYVIPLYEVGEFSINGGFVTQIARTRVPKTPVLLDKQPVWDQYFGSRIGALTLQKGDVLEYTLLGLVPPFHDLAVR